MKNNRNSKYMLTKGTTIVSYNTKSKLTKELQKIKNDFKKNGTEIIEYVKGEKLLYIDKKIAEMRIFEIRKA